MISTEQAERGRAGPPYFEFNQGRGMDGWMDGWRDEARIERWS